MNQLDNENLSVRIVTADYYLHKPILEFGDQCYSAFRSLPVYHVPIIRIFGPTTEGVKTCVHVHGVYPYIFVPNWNNEICEKDLYNFAASLDKAINSSFAHTNSKSTHVHKITQVSGKPFYGYHENERNFLKIEFYNPAMVKRAADLLLNAAVLNQVFQPHEAHIPYILQFFIDNNLYGMSNITFSSFRVRKSDSQSDMNETIIHSDSNVPKSTYSKLEVDITVSNLYNVLSSGENVPNNPGLAFIWEEEKKRRRYNDKSSQITPNISQERPEKPVTRTELYFREKLLQKLQAIKDNENCVDIPDETSSLNTTYEELNSQSRSLLEMLESLGAQQENNRRNETRSSSNSPSIVCSDDETNPANISTISSQPLLQFQAEADSILGNNFSDEENDLDDVDHRALSQSMTYTRHEQVSSDDSDFDNGVIPQLDGAHSVDNKRKTRSTTTKRGRPSKNKNNESDTSSIKSYNLRSRNKIQTDSKAIETFKPRDFKIVLNRLDTKSSPVKGYPRLNIDTQKSPKFISKFSNSFENTEETSRIVAESEPSGSQSPSVMSRSPNTSSASKNDKRVYPQLNVSVIKSPKLSKTHNKPSRGLAGHGMKKRKIQFEDETKKNVNTDDAKLTKWKKSLKRCKNDDTSFKIGESFSLLEFRNMKRTRDRLKVSINENASNSSSDISSQSYSLRVSDAGLSTEQNVQISDESDMESLMIRDTDEVSTLSSRGTDHTEKSKYTSAVSSDLQMIDSDDELILAVPLDDIDQLSKNTETRCSYEPKSSDRKFTSPIYEDSLIELDVLKSNNKNDQISGPEFQLKSTPETSNTTSVKNVKNTVIQTCSENSANSQNKTVVSAYSDNESSMKTPKQGNSSRTKTRKKPPNKKSLGMRIRKNTKMESQSRIRNSQSEELPSSNLTCRTENLRRENSPVKKLTLEYPSSSVESGVTKCDKRNSNCLSNDEASFQLKIDESLPVTVSDSDGKHGTGEVTKTVTNQSLSYQDSCIELDIFKCNASQQIPVDVKSPCGSNKQNEILPSPVMEKDTKIFDSPSQRLLTNCPVNSSTSSNEKTVEPNVDVFDDSLLYDLDALTPETNAALNEQLNSAQSENLSMSPSILEDVNISIPLGNLADSPDYVMSPETLPEMRIISHADSETENSSEDLSPSILDKTHYSIPDLNSQQTADEVLFEDELEAGPSHKHTELESLLLNNSIWDSFDDDQCCEDDNGIKSFYCTPSHITVIRDTAKEDSSPIAQPLTSQNEILSFYGSQSPEADVCSVTEFKEIDTSVVECSQPKRRKSQSVHSTPRSLKKSPSPTYTPILKKLMISRTKEKRFSSQLFKSQPTLSEIEEESPIKDVNTTLSLPAELDKSKNEKSLNTSRMSSCSGGSYQIDGVTCAFKMNLENLQDVKTDKQYQYITAISMEIFAQTRGDLQPDPEYDAVTCVFYSIHHDAANFPKFVSGIIVVGDNTTLTLDVNRFKCEQILVPNEAALFDEFLKVIRKWDPDMFIGYEVEMLSWGYFIQRAHFLGRNYSQELSRVIETKTMESNERALEDDEYSSEIKLTGRIVLNVWRLMRHEVNLQSYTFENILFHVQHQRVPYHTFRFLTGCWKDPLKRWIVIDYFLFRAESNIMLLDQLDFICRTSELARLFGIQFYEVLSRGSQFRVESMMLRMAKTQNYVAVSPSVKQRFNMRAPECLPLIMEPESKFYTDPVIVLDFQSLYPSIVIAYNYCFSTCLGRIESLGQSEPFHFGCVEHQVSADLLLKLQENLNLSPAGVAFVNKTIRKGILPSMLEEILETRLMVKKSMKENKDNSILKRVLHARQLGLKLIANVTYGYTSANFSGRMPCMEVADSVVSKGRETLERAIELVKNTKKWGAKVVYGDTDSLFVLVPNRTKEEAFRIGAEIADAVTNENPKPVKLKLEKVYIPCMLQTKKRYVGYMYESPDQEKPSYDAKGIETVRRDGCPAVSKILEKSLKLLFETKNVITAKQYVQRQFTKLISGRISIQELTFAREYRGMNNYKPAACVPALQLAKQALLRDRRAEPRIKERVRYVIISGPPGVPLIRLVRTPQEFLDTPGSLINTEYYITRAIIPALERCFVLMNVNVNLWYSELPKKQKLNLPIDYEMQNRSFKKTTISHYFSSSKCLSCSKVTGNSVCKQCIHKPQRVALILGNMINEWQRKYNHVAKICRSCCGRNGPIKCSSLDCPTYYVYQQRERDAGQVRYVEDLRRQYLYI